jgi:hypothetical protein
VVSTPLLAEQLKWTDRELAIADSAEAFATQCINVYTDASRWTSLRKAALERIRKECSSLEFQHKLQQVLAEERLVGSSQSRTK